MRTKIFQITFAVVFMTLLIMPLAFVDLYGGKVSERENRVLTARPPISLAFEWPRGFIRQLDNWFSDNVGFREQMIGLYKMINQTETQGQYTNGQYIYLIGEEGHHFFADVDGDMIPKYQGKPILSGKQLSSLTNGLGSIKDYLDEKGIPLIVMFCVDKETIYPEFYPRTIRRGPEPIQLDIITEYIESHTDVNVFNIRARLLREKGNYFLYNKSIGDLTHYNQTGAFFAYQELMKHINEYFPDIRAISLEDITITYDENDMAAVLMKRERTFEELEQSFFDTVNVNRPFTWENRAFVNTDLDFPTIFMLCDSYTGGGPFLANYIPEHFSQTILIHYQNMEHFKEYIEAYNPDIVVFEAAERQLLGFANVIMDFRLP